MQLVATSFIAFLLLAVFTFNECRERNQAIEEAKLHNNQAGRSGQNVTPFGLSEVFSYNKFACKTNVQL